MRKREDLKFFASIHKRSLAVLAELLGGWGGGGLYESRAF